MAHQRLRPFNTSMFYKQATVAGGTCMAVRAGNQIFLRGQTGFTLDGGFIGLGDAAAQAEQAMQTIRVLLEEAGAKMAHIRKLTTYVTDRAWWEPVHVAIDRHLGDVTPVRTGVIVNGLATPEMLVEIDVDAVISEA